MAKLDLYLVDCWRDGVKLAHECKACDWRDFNTIPDPIGKVICGMTGEVFDIIYGVVDIDLDIDVIQQPETRKLRPCEPTRCVAQSKGGG